MDDLTQGVHAGIGAPGAHQAHRLGSNAAEGSLGGFLHAADTGLLGLPAGEWRAVVLQGDGNPWQGS